jgi:ABC-type antimicrobial peptide transport system permease subunit
VILFVTEVSLAAALLPALHATRINPLIALKYE